jgi:phosphoribosyl-ATP pyrophosphohydrolase/phosphoribosyl-AMP cyclohydrolase/histidinol dehydrogenase
MSFLLRRLDPDAVLASRRAPVDPETLAAAAEIVEDVREGGAEALRRHAERLGDLVPGAPLLYDAAALGSALAELPTDHQDLLTRVAERIQAFAEAQRSSLTDITVEVEGGEAGHRWVPVASAGAYAPGGRYPLPSSVLMTVVPARVAGVATVWVASPRPSAITLAAAAVAGADGLLAVGGAQAIAALAFGILSPACDLIVGPGNKWVTAAKKHLFGEVGIDSLAGPSEILVLADDGADPRLVAADLLAQAEHDTEAVPMLITTSPALADAVEAALPELLSDLPTAEIARGALDNGFCVVVDGLESAIGIADRLAPEHLALHVNDPEDLATQLSAYGSLFLGRSSAEAFADYGAGPNHVLPTGGGARFQSGLSVATFLRSPTWLRLETPEELVEDTVLLARLEGLEAHARAAIGRRG